MIKRNDHQVFHLSIWRSCRGCSLGELAGSRVLFLQEQVRDLRVQEFLRELVVGVAAPSDLAGLILVEILHCGEGGDVEQLELRNKSPVFAIAYLSLTCFFYLACFLYLCSSITCLICTCALLIYLLGIV